MKVKKYILLAVQLFFLSMLVGCGLFENASDTSSNEEAVKEVVESVKVRSEKEETNEKPKSQTEESEIADSETSEEEADLNDENNETEEIIEEDKADEEAETNKIEEEKIEEEKIEEVVVSEPVVEPASGTYYVTAPSLNVRSGDGTAYQALGFVTLNTGISVTGITSNGWYEFTYNGNKGYVSGNYLSKEKQVVKEEAPVPEEKKKTPEQPSNNNNVVDNMTTLGNNQQVILVTTKGSSTTTGQFQTFEKDSNGKWNRLLHGTAYVGKTGMTSNKQEGDGKTPIGKFSLGTAFGYAGNPGTKLNFKHSTEDDVWVDDSNSKYYNTWQQNSNPDKDWNSAESMMHRLYNYGIVINYNTEQTPGKGSAIFLHVGNSYTLGCVAVSQSNIVNIMQWLDPAKNPVIIQTPESGLGNY